MYFFGGPFFCTPISVKTESYDIIIFHRSSGYQSSELVTGFFEKRIIHGKPISLVKSGKHIFFGNSTSHIIYADAYCKT